MKKTQRSEVEIEVNKGMMEYLRKEIEKMGFTTKTRYLGQKDQVDFDFTYGLGLSEEEESGFAGVFTTYIKGKNSIYWFDTTHCNGQFFASFANFGYKRTIIASSADKECIQKSAKYLCDMSNKINMIDIGKETKEYGL